MVTFVAPPIQRTMPKPSLSVDSQPPQTPPASNMTAAAARRFLFAFFHVHSLGSLTRSLYTLVNTVVGISPYPNARLAATCAPNCHARKGIPINTLLLFEPGCGITSVVMKMAARRIDMPCSRKEMESVSRRVVPNGRATAEEMREPIMKLKMASKDRSHCSGAPFLGRSATPRARKMVFPLGIISLCLFYCMEFQ